MYDELLTADKSVSDWLLDHLDQFKSKTDITTELGKYPLSLIDTVGAQERNSPFFMSLNKNSCLRDKKIPLKDERILSRQ